MKFMYYGLQSYQRVGSGRAHNSKMSNGRNFRKKIVRRLNKIFGLLNVEALDLEKKTGFHFHVYRKNGKLRLGISQSDAVISDSDYGSMASSHPGMFLKSNGKALFESNAFVVISTKSLKIIASRKCLTPLLGVLLRGEIINSSVTVLPLAIPDPDKGRYSKTSLFNIHFIIEENGKRISVSIEGTGNEWKRIVREAKNSIRGDESE